MKFVNRLEGDRMVTEFHYDDHIEVWPVLEREIPIRYRVLQDEWSTDADGRKRRRIIAWETTV